MSKKYDAILIPGGGVKKNGSLPEWTKRRLKKTLDIFTGREYLITLSAGTVHKAPLLDKLGFPLYESVVAANYLIKNNIPPIYILIENVSLDTIGNAYFARAIHTEQRRFRKLCIITSDFHMLRTKTIFEWIFKLTPLPFKYELDFIKVSDKGIDFDLLKVRCEKEKKALERLIKTKKEIKTIKQFHQWMFSKHSAYAVGLKPKIVKGKTLRSY